MPKLIVGGLLFSLLPIWRGAGHTRHDGVNLWQLASDMTKSLDGDNSFGHPHITYEEAKRRAREAYELTHQI